MQKKEEFNVKVSSILKTTPRKLKLIAEKICGKSCNKVSFALQTERKRVYPDIVKALKNGVHLLSRHHDVAPEDTYIKEAYVGKYKKIKKIRYYAKGRACYGGSFLTRITLILSNKTDA